VSPEYFEFGKHLMQVIVDALTSQDFDRSGRNAVLEGWAYIEKEMESLRQQFLECAKNFTAIDEKTKLKTLKKLVEKTRNARFGVVTNARRDEKTRRGGKNHVGTTHRGGMKSTKEGSKVNKELKLSEIGDE